MLKKTMLILPLLLFSCTSQTPVPQPSASPAPSSNARPQTDYDLFTWRDLNDDSRRCRFAIVPAVGKDFGQLLTAVDAGMAIGLSTLESRVRALPEGSSLLWSARLGMMASRYYSLMSPATVNRIKQVAAERKITLSLDADLPAHVGPSDEFRGCIE